MWNDLERPPLREAELTRALVAPHGPYAALTVSAHVGSTNSELSDRARAGAPDRTVLIAEHQSAGRGRGTRSWTAPERSGLFLSVLVRPTGVPIGRWGWLPLLTGLALCDTVVEVAKIDAAVKWPNDLLLPSGKGAGILAEVVGTGADAAIVVGVGLNVTLRADERPVPEASSLLIDGAAVTDRDTLARAFLRGLARRLDAWTSHRGDPEASGLRTEYLERCATVGLSVRVELPAGGAVSGVAIDVDEEGRLVLDGPDGVRPLSAGDVHHVRPG